MSLSFSVKDTVILKAEVTFPGSPPWFTTTWNGIINWKLKWNCTLIPILISIFLPLSTFVEFLIIFYLSKVFEVPVVLKKLLGLDPI